MKKFLVFSILGVLTFAADKKTLDLKPKLSPDADSQRIQEAVKNPPPPMPSNVLLQFDGTCTDSMGVIHDRKSRFFEHCMWEAQKARPTDPSRPTTGIQVTRPISE